ncbi:MAG: VOC family protein [Desulfatitalea sp.]
MINNRSNNRINNKINYSGINHLALVTRDMTATIRFWRDLLGMRLVAGLGRSGYRHYFFEISTHDMLSFFEWPTAEPIPEKDHGVPVRGPVAFDHVAIGVTADADLWEIKQRLETAGFWVSEVIDHGFIHSIYSFDPNRIPIEFSAPVPSVDLRTTPQMRDKNPLPAAQEGPAPSAGHWPSPGIPTPMDERVVYPGEGVVFASEFLNDTET